MIRYLVLGFLLTAGTGIAASASAESLGLTRADLSRLGVVLQPPEIVTEVEIAAAPAEVVIPPAQQAIVGTTLSGLVSRILVAEGDSVTAGQPLAEITSAELLDLQHDFIEAALTADLARVQLERDSGLYADGIIAERRVRESRAAARAAISAEDQARQVLELAGMTDAELGRLLDTGELGSRLLLRAPMAAVVIEQLASLGQRVDALDPVHRVADLSTLWLELHVAPELSGRVEPGMRVVAQGGGRVINARVTQIGRVSDSMSQTVLVRATIAEHDPTLRAGQFLSSRILDSVRESRTVFAVPSAAIVRNDGDSYVFSHREGDVMAAAVEIVADAGNRAFVHGDLDREVGVAVDGVAALKSVWLSGEEEGD